MTGAPIPAGADAVVMVEDTERLDDGESRPRAGHRGARRRRAAGGERRAHGRRRVHGRHRRDARRGGRAGEHQRPHGAGRIQRCVSGCCPRATSWSSTAGRSRPDRSASPTSRCSSRCSPRPAARCGRTAWCWTTKTALEARAHDAAAECDAIVTSGGVSMGDYDVVKAVLGRIAEMEWMQVAIKPAKPFAFGTLAGAGDRAVPVFGLPGNPVSSLVSFEMFARPALRRMMGHRRLARPSVVAVTDADLQRRPDGRTHLDAGGRRVRRRRARARRARSAPRAATSSPPPRWPTRWSWSTTATASPPAPRWPRSCSMVVEAAFDAPSSPRPNGGLTPEVSSAAVPSARTSPPPVLLGRLVANRGRSLVAWRTSTSLIPSGASSATCASRSPTAATSAARTA